jgi:hypothetical protein
MNLDQAQARKLAAQGHLLVPTQISWRHAQQFVAAGRATLYPFHERWLGRLDFAPQPQPFPSDNGMKS